MRGFNILYQRLVLYNTSECLASLGLESLESRGRRVNSGECDHRSNAFRIKK